MNIYIEQEDRTLQKEFSGTATELLKELSINPTTVLLVNNNEVILAEDSLSNDDDLKILSVVSGG